MGLPTTPFMPMHLKGDGDSEEHLYTHNYTFNYIHRSQREKKNAIVSQQQANLPGMRNNCAHAWFVSLHGMSCHVMRAWPVMLVLHMYID